MAMAMAIATMIVVATTTKQRSTGLIAASFEDIPGSSWKVAGVFSMSEYLASTFLLGEESEGLSAAGAFSKLSTHPSSSRVGSDLPSNPSGVFSFPPISQISDFTVRIGKALILVEESLTLLFDQFGTQGLSHKASTKRNRNNAQDVRAGQDINILILSQKNATSRGDGIMLLH